MPYIPEPIDTASVSIPPGLSNVMDDIARNTHDVWAKARMDEGWTWGAVYDAAQKKHPLLIPYGELPESEKEYDRNTSGQTVKALLKMGGDCLIA